MTTSRVFAGFSVVFCRLTYVLLVGLNVRAEVPSGDTVQVGVTGSLSIQHLGKPAFTNTGFPCISNSIAVKGYAMASLQAH